ncbi:MAG TPA: DUF2235 domain-containing protein [Stellaceae bacterium]|nr:DUF2235 domain-containing protein [Stellaceae bacterium]
MAKSIIVLADGTGNSSGTFTRTNVWRLYRALDLAPAPAGARQQVAYYHDGVGTSAFKPLMWLGGAFGWGLKRNVIELYEFVCRNYQPGDDIYAFGFSRGAFTVRVLIGIICHYGLVPYTGEAALHREALAVYRDNRTRFEDRALVKVFRFFRHHTLRAGRRLFRLASPRRVYVEVKHIAFVGVWDTVAAYGMPIAELTRGIDRLIWPMDLPNLALSKKVSRARQALALDEARETFHPMPWDEVHEAQLVARGEIAADRLKQVWFPGMHADIGGGYADDALAFVALDWMMEEAGPRTSKAGGVGLRYLPRERQQVAAALATSAPMHDSRTGLGSYYRYQPRKIAGFLDPPAPNTLIQQDPDLRGCGLLVNPLIHHTVLDRIERGPDAYAPIGLPADYREVLDDGSLAVAPREAAGGVRARLQESVWDGVWRRRTLYFLTVLASLGFAALPFVLPATTCAGPQCLASPLINALGLFLPGFAAAWVESYSQHAGAFLIMAALLLVLRAASQTVQTRMQDRMRRLWDQSLPGPLTAPAKFRPSGLSVFRSSKPYQRLLHRLKWTALPWVFGLSLIFLAGVIGVVWPLNRALIAYGEDHRWYCRPGLAGKSSFATIDPCTKIAGATLSRGKSYRLTLKVTTPWIDSTIDTNPAGFGAERAPLLMRILGTPLRRSLNDRWFQPIAQIIAANGERRSLPLEMRLADQSAFPSYAAEFAAPLSGELYLYVNDALSGWPGFGYDFYVNNGGTADVTVVPLAAAQLKFELPRNRLP